MVIVNRNIKMIIFVELTVCFENGKMKAHARNPDNYITLINNLTYINYDSKLYTIEVGSRCVLRTII